MNPTLAMVANREASRNGSGAPVTATVTRASPPAAATPRPTSSNGRGPVRVTSRALSWLDEIRPAAFDANTALNAAGERPYTFSSTNGEAEM